MAYSNKYYSSGWYSNLWPRPQFKNGEVVVDDIRHKVGNEWSSISPGSTDNTGKLILSGFAYAYATIEIYDNGKLIKTVSAGKLGTWNANLSDVLSSGEHNFMVKQAGYDFAPGAPINISVQGNNSAIPVEITQVYDDVGIHKGIIEQGKTTDDARPTFSGTGQANALVTLIDESNNVIASGYADKYGNWQITPEFAIADGNHNVRAFIEGKFSSAFNITIDAAPTQYPLTFTDAFDYLTANTIFDNGLTNDARPGFSGKAEPGSFVYLFVEGSNEPIGGSVANGFGNWTITPFKDLQIGTQTLEVRGDNQFTKFTVTVGAESGIQSVNELLFHEEASLFAETSEPFDAPKLVLTQADLNSESLSSGVATMQPRHL